MNDISSPTWVEEMLALCAMREVEAPGVIGWPVGTLVVNTHNGRRGSIAMSEGDDCSIQFDQGSLGNYWITTWDVVLRNYRKV